MGKEKEGTRAVNPGERAMRKKKKHLKKNALEKKCGKEPVGRITGTKKKKKNPTGV